MPSHEMQATLDYLRSVRDQTPPEPDPAAALRATRERAELLAVLYPTPDDVVVEPLALGGVPADRLTPPGAATDRVLLYLHGGAYVAYSPRSHRELAARTARAAGCVAVVPDYRLAPEHPYPAAVEDAVAVYEALLQQGATVAVAGDSAGGGLALALLQRLRTADRPLPRAVALLSPWTDLALNDPSVSELATEDVLLDVERLRRSGAAYAGVHRAQDPELSPVHADLTSFPPLHVEVGTAEVLLSDSTRLAARAEAAGVDVVLHVAEGLPHVFQVFATTPEAQESTDRVGAFLRRHQS